MNTTPRAPRTDIAQIAKVAHDANRSFCMTIGDPVPPTWEEASLEQRQSIMSGVAWRIANPYAAPGAQHESWRQSKIANGWKLGPKKDEATKEHPNLVPHTDLPLNQQLKDALFMSIVDALWIEQIDIPSGNVPPGIVIQAGANNDPSVEVGKPAAYLPENVAMVLLALGFKTVDEGLSYMYTHKGRGCWINNISSPAEIMPLVADTYEGVGQRTKINEFRKCLDLPTGVIDSLRTANESNKPS